MKAVRVSVLVVAAVCQLTSGDHIGRAYRAIGIDGNPIDNRTFRPRR